MQNATIEERVALLEIQVVEIQEDVSGLDEDVTLLEGDVNFLFDETVIQDERIFTLEQTSIETTADVEGIFLSFMFVGILIHINLQLILCFSDLQDITLALDFRVTILEENGGSDGNSSVAELEVRVETLEGTAADHETRISDTETDINGKLNDE